MFLTKFIPATLRQTFSLLDLPTSDRLRDQHIYHLMIIYVLITAPLLTALPFWIMAIAASIVGIKTYAVRNQLRIPRYIIVLLLIFSIGVIALSVPILGQEHTGLALLFLFASLKLLETKAERDAYLLMLINMLLITGALMTNKTNGFVFVYMLLLFFYNIYIQLIIAQPKNVSADIMGNLKWIGKMALIALPFVVLLFLLFPRFEPLWNTNFTQPKAVTGLSDSMSPGQFSGLAQSEDLAFRVQFKSSKPAPTNLYWRGPILSQYDGITWTRTPARFSKAKQVKVDKNSAVVYDLTLVGETAGWIPALDIVADMQKNNLFQNYSLDIIQRPTKKSFKRGEFTSYTKYSLMEFNKIDKTANTYLPEGSHPETRAFATKQWLQAGEDPRQFINNILKYIRDNEYEYYLESFPGSDDLDTFWFNIKIGYCEHYANALAVMLRSVGLPARIATGYQGGELNPISKTFEVRQLNAHAWVEVYLENEGWLRVDPTAAVAPQRINSGRLQGSVKDNDQLSLTTRLREDNAVFASAINHINAGKTFWDNWVANFDSDKQAELLRRLGLTSDNARAILIFGLLLLIPIILLIRWIIRHVHLTKDLDDVERLMRQFDKKLARLGIIRKDNEPYSRLILRYPEKLKAARLIIHIYEQIRYYPHNNKEISDLITRLKNRIKQFSLVKK